MSYACVVLRDGPHTRTARVHKTALNAFQDIRWFQETMDHHSLMALFDGPAVAEDETFEYGLVVIDRNSRWLGSCQGYMPISSIETMSQARELDALAGYDMDADLAQFAIHQWGQVLTHPLVRLSILQRAYEADAIRRIKAAHMGLEQPWRNLEYLGLDTLPKALDWLYEQRKNLAQGKCMMVDCGFEFEPDGWSIVDYDMDSQVPDFAQALAFRKFVPPMDETQTKSWWSRFSAF